VGRGSSWRVVGLGEVCRRNGGVAKESRQIDDRILLVRGRGWDPVIGIAFVRMLPSSIGTAVLEARLAQSLAHGRSGSGSSQGRDGSRVGLSIGRVQSLLLLDRIGVVVIVKGDLRNGLRGPW